MIKPEGGRQCHLMCFELVCNICLELYHFKELLEIQNVFPVFPTDTKACTINIWAWW